MDDRLEFVANLEVPQAEAWRRCRLPAATAADRCRVPGFPSVDGEPGCAAAVLECVPQKLLRCRKLDTPCAGTEIAIRLEPANAAGWPTRVTLSQHGFGGVLPREVLEVHWRHIAADFLLYLEREITVPGTAWGISLDADVRQTPTGLAVSGVAERGLAGRYGPAISCSPSAPSACTTWRNSGRSSRSCRPTGRSHSGGRAARIGWRVRPSPEGAKRVASRWAVCAACGACGTVSSTP